ncbi:DUF6916 family protein [Sphingomonas sp. MMS24-J45]|uniref:DUF6916 family protein n=1 Tax=Sphingomonas sp. MMS24-J45 TaxID=3238806 RepID=UPI00384ECD88
MSIATLTCEDFAAQLGTVFLLQGAEGTTMPLTLAEANPGPGAAYAGRAPFSLIFRSAAQQVVPQGFYRLEHPVMGPLEITFAPVARTAAGIDYEAVFN